MKFKTEVSLLVLAIALFGVASFFYSYVSAANETVALSTQSLAYPYRGVALVFLGVGSLSMVTASISYSKKTKELLH
ncbi:MAG: hypothetical protein M1540_01750 [Candidatus Bathyarchaeota archaeon]|nr:hypothetical protein [Candidatus Bathyarchaeota archaeon]